MREFSRKPRELGYSTAVDHAPSVQRALDSVPVHSNNKKMSTHKQAHARVHTQAHRTLTASSVDTARKQVIAHLNLNSAITIGDRANMEMQMGCPHGCYKGTKSQAHI